MKPRCSWIYLPLLLAGCGQAPTPAPPPPDLAAEEKAVREYEASWSKDMASRDIEKMLSHYTDDAVLIAPGAAPMKGKAGIKEGAGPMLADSNFKLVFSPERVDVSKDASMASSQGSYEMTMTNPKTKKPETEKGSYVTVYKKTDAGWRAVYDINTSGPAAAK